MSGEGRIYFSEYIQTIERAERLSIKNRRPYIAAVGERLAATYSAWVDPTTSELMTETVDALWMADAVEWSTSRLPAAWRGRTVDQYIAISVGFASVVYFFRLAVDSCADEELINAPLQYMAHAIVFFSPGPRSDAPPSLTTHEAASPGHDPWHAWVRSELELQDCLVDAAERAEAASDLLTRQAAATTCVDARTKADADWSVFARGG